MAPIMTRHVTLMYRLAGLCLLVSACSKLPAASTTVADSSDAQIQYQKHELSRAIVHTVRIPKRYRLKVAVADQLTTVEQFADDYRAIAVLNGGFFDPVNQQTTSHIIIDGQVAADPSQNQRLVGNPKLGPYLDKILNRSEFRQYQCGETTRFDIVSHQTPTPTNCRVVTALGGGPRLLPQLTLQEEGFLDTNDGQITRDPLGSTQPNARSAIGLTSDGDVIWVMAAQKPQSSPSGLSLAEMATFMKQLGIQQALNLDGGTSSSLVYQQQVYTGKFTSSGQPILRPVKSVLLVQEEN